MNWIKPRTQGKGLDKLKHSALSDENFRNIMEHANQLYQEKGMYRKALRHEQLHWYIQMLDFAEQ